MANGELSDAVKLGICICLMVFTFGIGFTLFRLGYEPAREYVFSSQHKIYGVDTMTLVELTTKGEVNGATLYTAMSQYGTELAGVIWTQNGTKTLYTQCGVDKSQLSGINYDDSCNIKALLDKIKETGFEKTYTIVRSAPEPGVSYQPQTMFIGIGVK